MNDGAACDLARATRRNLTESSQAGPVCAVLRTADGVRIEAAYQPRRTGPPSPASPARRPHVPHQDRPRQPSAEHPAPPRTGTDHGVIVLAHGFTGSLERPALRRAAAVFAQYAAVVTFSFRGHGRSGGRSTVGDREVLDLAAAVAWARSFGHRAVATVGFSMGGSVVLRHGALHRAGGAGGHRADERGARAGRDEDRRPDGHTPSISAPVVHGGRTVAHPPGRAPDPAAATGPRAPATHADAPHADSTHAPATQLPATHADAVVAVSAPARWYYRGTAPMRRLHWAIQHPAGRLVARYGLRTRVHHRDWDPVPLSPVAAAPLIAPVPLLIVHGDRDPYFPVDHPRALAEAADPATSQLWLEPGFGHAENAADPALLHRIGDWAATRLHAPAGRPHHGSRAGAVGTGGAGTAVGTDGTEGTDG